MSNSNSSNGCDAAGEFSFPHIGTAAVRSGFEPEKYRGWPVVLPISLATTFKQAAPAEHHVWNIYFVLFVTPVTNDFL